MSRTLSRIFLATLAIIPLISTRAAGETIAILHVYWNGPSRPDPRLIQKTLDAQLAQDLKKHLNLADPAGIVDISIRFDGTDIELFIGRKGAPQPTADEIVGMIKEHFIVTASNFFKELAARDLEQARAEDTRDLDMARNAQEEARQRLQKVRQQLRELTGRVDVSPETLRLTITRIEEERDRVALDFEGQTVRRKAIEETIAEITKKARVEMGNDRITAELEKLVASRETDLKRLQQLRAENSVSEAEVDAAQGRIGEARVRLWERQEMVNRSIGGDLLADLTKELTTLSIAMTESEMRLKRLMTGVDRFARAADLIDELEIALSARQAAEAARADAVSRLAETNRALRQYQPPVVMLK